MSFKHLSLSEREVLFGMLLLGYSHRDIALKLGRSQSSVSREIKKNTNKKTIIHFWFSYCHPCIKDFPELLKIGKENNIEIINISSDKSDSKMQDNLEKVMTKLNVKDCFIIDFDNLYPTGTKCMNVLGDFAKKIELKEYTNPYYILIDEKGKTLIATEELEKLKEHIK
jgi:thiol-disulfide isomerase/thioredoxin